MSQRKILICILFMCIFCTACFPAVCYADFASTNKKIVKVGYLPGYGIFLDTHDTNHQGYGYDYLQKIATITGWEYEFYPVGWSQGLQMLETGEIDIFGPMQKTPEREAVFAFPDIAIGYEHGVLYTRKDAQIDYEDWNRFKDMRIGTNVDNYFNQPLLDYMQKHNIDSHLVFTLASEYEQGLINGDFDAVIAGSLLDIPDTKMIGKVCTSSIFLATTKGNTEILEGLNAALEQIMLENAYYAAKLQEKYYGDKPISSPAFTSGERGLTEKYSSLRVAYDPHFTTLQYEKDGAAHGIGIDILREISKNASIPFVFDTLDKPYQKVMAEDYDFADLYINLEAITDSDLEHTESYLEIPLLLVSTKTINLQENLAVGTILGKSPATKKLQMLHPNFTVVQYPSMNEMLTALIKNECDLLYITSYAFDDIARKYNTKNFITIPTENVLSLNIGINKNLEPELVSLLNKSISKVSTEQINSIIFSNTVDRAYQVPFSQIIRDNAFTIISIVLVLSILVLWIVLKTSRTAQKKLEEMAYIDSIAQVLTPLKFKIDVQSALQNAIPNEYMLVSLDIDRFKYINDTFGYEEGNAVLRSMGKFLKNLDKNNIVCREYTDHFLIFCKALPEEQIKQQYDMLVKQQYFYKTFHNQLKLNISIGCYYITDCFADIATMSDKANFARTTLKNYMDHKFTIYTQEMDDGQNRQKDILMNMESALENKEFVVYLQPKYRLKDITPIGAEALVRWQSPTLGFIAPNDFIPLFEKNGFINRLDYYVFEQICALVKKWMQTKTLPDYYTGRSILSVNLSEYSLMQPNHIEGMIALASQYDLPPSLFEIELTESFRIENIQHVRLKMQQLKDAGFHISIDDFGSGYSSLNLLKDLPTDILKIDKAFLDKSTDTDKGLKIISSIIQMAKNLHIHVIAEGVETKEQMQFLSEMGCDFAQGYYFAKPMPISEFEQKYA